MKNILRIIKVNLLILFTLSLGSAGASVPYAGDGYISLYNVHLNEEVNVQYRFRNGQYNDMALEQINHTFRCRLTKEIHEIPAELIELLDEIQDHFQASQLKVVSGYRSPTLNSSLRRSGRKVAKYSYHMHGKAMDIQIPGISTYELRQFALSLGKGGVGYYPGRQFVHVDVGPVRQW